MKSKIIFLATLLYVCTAPVSAQLEVDSLGNTLISKNLYFVNESGYTSMHSLFSKDSDTYWCDSFGGMKMGVMGKLFLNPSDFGWDNIFNTEIDYTFNPPYVYIHPYNDNAALTIRSGACRPLHTILGNFVGGPHEGIRSDVYISTDKPFVAYSVATVSDLDKPTSMQVFSVNGTGLVYGMSGFSQASDGRLKKDVHNIASGMERISALRGVSFRYKSAEKAVALASNVSDTTGGYLSEDIKRQVKEEEGRARIGFIAQEVEDIVPEVIRTLPDGTKTIMYTDLIPLLVEGMKEMQETIATQEIRIVELETILSDTEHNVKVARARSSSLDEDGSMHLPVEAALCQNVPNPFTRTTEIAYRLFPNARSASIGIYDLNGKQLKHYPLQPDTTTGKVEITASELVSGIYLYALLIDGTMIDSKRMILE